MRPASFAAAMMRSASRAAAAPPLPVSISSDSPDGEHEQRRVAAFDVDDVDVERLRRALR